MNIRDLKYLVTVARLKHFGKAAEQCFVSQPTLSAQIKKLEEELGVKLFERNNKNVMLTEAGTELAKKAQGILNEVDEFKQLAQNINDPFAGSLHLGIIPTLSAYLLPHLVPIIKKQLPKLTPYFHEDQTHRLIKQLKAGELDAILLAFPIPADGLTCLPLFDEPFYLALPTKHPLAKKPRVNVADIDSNELLLLQEGHCLRDQALSFCQQAGVTQRLDFQATSLETLRQMVAAGTGITLLPALACENGISKKLMTTRPLVKPAPSREIGLAFRTQTSKQACLDKLASIIKTQFVPNHSELSVAKEKP